MASMVDLGAGDPSGMAQKGDSELPHVFLTNRGVPLDSATVANNKNSKIQNLWNKTINRIQKDAPLFQRLSFNKLRKTASNIVRHEAGPEVASLMLAHGESFAGDDLLDLYTNRPFAKLHTACGSSRRGFNGSGMRWRTHSLLAPRNSVDRTSAERRSKRSSTCTSPAGPSRPSP